MGQFLGHELALTTVAQYVEIANVGIARGLEVALTETNTGVHRPFDTLLLFA